MRTRTIILSSLICTGLGLLLISSLAVADSPPSLYTTNLQLYYNYNTDNGATVVDSIGGHNGTATGATLTTNSAGGKVRVFASGDYIQTPDTGSFLNAPAQTVVMWINADALSGDNYLWGQTISSSNYMIYRYAGFTPGEYTVYGYYNCNGVPTEYSMTGNLSLCGSNKWFMLTFSRNTQGQIYLYANGAAEAGSQLANFRYYINDTNPLRIGERSAGSPTFAGSIGEVLYYNACLTPAQINQVYEATYPHYFQYDKVITAIGNSITWGINSDPYESWPMVLNGRIPDARIYNKGVSGDWTSTMLARFQTDVVDYHPDYVLIGDPRNDISNGVSLTTIEANEAAMCDMALQNGITPVLQTLVPYNNDPVTLQYNQWVVTYATNNRLKYIDFYTPMDDPTHAGYMPSTLTTGAYSSGGLHPNNLGYEVMGDSIDLSVVDSPYNNGYFATGTYGGIFTGASAIIDGMTLIVGYVTSLIINLVPLLICLGVIGFIVKFASAIFGVLEGAAEYLRRLF